MSPKILRDVRFFALLTLLDLDLARQAREARCPRCGGPLHSARYPRKLRGLPKEGGDRFRQRESFCCAEEGCRGRTTPPSVVFFGRRLYHTAMVVLVSALCEGADERRLDRLDRLFRLDRRTLLRWQTWWRESFPTTGFFRSERGRFSPPLSGKRRLRDLLSRFAGAARDRLVSALLFFSPLSTTSVTRERARQWAGRARRGGDVTLN